MHQSNVKIKRALLSVSDKTGIIEFAKKLSAQNIELLSTGGTAKLLRDNNIPVRDVSDLTKFPEIMDGRVKTLHPKVHGGILGLRDEHQQIANEHQIEWIDLVVVNLYPFSQTIKKPDCSFDEAIENIDIGGPTMIRSAAKNMGWVTVVTDNNDYEIILKEIQEGIAFETRKSLAAKAFEHTANYDKVIHDYLTPSQTISLHLQKHSDLRYGENPQQKASAYYFSQASGILNAIQHQGKELSYNNITDADAAVSCAREYEQPACVIVKHANPCGVAVANNIEDAFNNAYLADSTSAFGGIVAINQTCTKEIAEKIYQTFFEVIIAPSYAKEALEIFSKKPNLRILELDFQKDYHQHEYKFVEGGLLIQDKDTISLSAHDLKVITQRHPSAIEIQSMLFAWKTVKHIKSNAILIAKNNVTIGIGAGQVSRVDAVELALKKSRNNLSSTVLASDAFFPFRDSIDLIAGKGITAIIQPGGSMRDEEVIAACNEHNIAMVFTGKRCFKH